MEQHQQPVFKVFLTGIATHYREEQLYNFFKPQYPSVIRVDLIKQKNDSGYSKGFGFMELASQKEQKQIIKEMYFYLNGRKFAAKEHKRGKALKEYKQEVGNMRLFISNVDPTVTNKELKQFFSKIVSVEDAYLIQKEKFSAESSKKAGGSKGRKGPRKTKYGYIVLMDEKDREMLVTTKKFKIKKRIAYVKAFDYSRHKKGGKNPPNKADQDQNQPNSSKVESGQKSGSPRQNKEKDYHHQPEEKSLGKSQKNVRVKRKNPKKHGHQNQKAEKQQDLYTNQQNSNSSFLENQQVQPEVSTKQPSSQFGEYFSSANPFEDGRTFSQNRKNEKNQFNLGEHQGAITKRLNNGGDSQQPFIQNCMVQDQTDLYYYPRAYEPNHQLRLTGHLPFDLRKKVGPTIQRGFNPNYNPAHPELGRHDIINNRLKTSLIENNHFWGNMRLNYGSRQLRTVF